MFVPQRPYIVKGSLRAQALYPAPEDEELRPDGASDARIRELFIALNLGHLLTATSTAPHAARPEELHAEAVRARRARDGEDEDEVDAGAPEWESAWRLVPGARMADEENAERGGLRGEFTADSDEEGDSSRLVGGRGGSSTAAGARGGAHRVSTRSRRASVSGTWGLDAVQVWQDVLSAGEQQRLGWVRVLLHRPCFAVCDER